MGLKHLPCPSPSMLEYARYPTLPAPPPIPLELEHGIYMTIAFKEGSNSRKNVILEMSLFLLELQKELRQQ